MLCRVPVPDARARSVALAAVSFNKLPRTTRLEPNLRASTGIGTGIELGCGCYVNRVRNIADIEASPNTFCQKSLTLTYFRSVGDRRLVGERFAGKRCSVAYFGTFSQSFYCDCGRIIAVPFAPFE